MKKMEHIEKDKLGNNESWNSIFSKVDGENAE